MSDLLADQFASRPTGSTTAAVIGISHHINEILAFDDYVIISLDFARRLTLSVTLLSHRNFLSLSCRTAFAIGLSNSCKTGHIPPSARRRPPLAHINASLIQGSGMGPSEYVISASGLHPVHEQNRIAKLADDTYLIPSSMRHTTDEELIAVQKWATVNNLKLNASKYKEIIVARRLAPSARPPPLQDIERVTEMLILGVILRGDLRASSHVNRVLSLCNGSFHALRVLRWHGLSADALSTVTEATIISRLLYASPAWWGLTSAEDRARLESFLKKLRRHQFLSSSVGSFESMADAADVRLLRAVMASDAHVLRQFFPPVAKRTYNLRPRKHPFLLPPKDDCYFVTRVFFKSVVHNLRPAGHIPPPPRRPLAPHTP